MNSECAHRTGEVNFNTNSIIIDHAATDDPIGTIKIIPDRYIGYSIRGHRKGAITNRSRIPYRIGTKTIHRRTR